MPVNAPSFRTGPAAMSYLLFKLLHVVAVVLFLGNITTGVFWVRQAARHRSPPRLAEAMATVIRSDRVFTLPAVLAILASGGLAAWRGGGSVMHTGWIAWGTGLFVLSGLMFAALAPLQHRLRVLAAREDIRWEDCAPLLRRWNRIGLASLLPAWLALAAMVLKLPA